MFLGIDLGTSGVKLCLAEERGVIATATAPLTLGSPHPGWSEQSPDAWWDATRAAAARLPDSARRRVRAIGLSGQMHGAVLLDAQHRPVRPAILWNDNRAQNDGRRLSRRMPDIGQRAGVPPLPGFTAPKLMWLAREEPDVHARIAHILLPKDYIGLMLHGGIATDRSDAAGTLWLDQASRAWDPDLARASDTEPGWLPPLHDGQEVVGRLRPGAASALGLPHGVPVVAGGGDAATGAISLGATEPGRGFISLGTSGQLFLADRAYRPRPDRMVHAFAHTIPDRWYQMAAMLNGARPIAWLAERLSVTPGEVVALAETADPGRLPIFLPYLTGERSPHGDPEIRAGFFGIEEATGRAELSRAVLEAVAFTFADAVESFGDSMTSQESLLAIGGGTRSDLLLQWIAEATGKRIGRAEAAEAGPAWGAARLAACGAGALSLADLGEVPEVRHWFDPAPAPALHDRLRRFRALYRAVKDLR